MNYPSEKEPSDYLESLLPTGGRMEWYDGKFRDEGLRHPQWQADCVRELLENDAEYSGRISEIRVLPRTDTLIVVVIDGEAFGIGFSYMHGVSDDIGIHSFYIANSKLGNYNYDSRIYVTSVDEGIEHILGEWASRDDHMSHQVNVSDLNQKQIVSYRDIMKYKTRKDGV